MVFILNCQALTLVRPHGSIVRLRWRISESLKPWRRLWFKIKRWQTYIKQNLVYPRLGFRIKEPIDQPQDCQPGNTILRESVLVKIPSRDQALEAGLPEKAYQRLIDLRRRSHDKAIRIIQNFDRSMTDCSAVELTAAIQGLGIHCDDIQDCDNHTLNKMESPREAINLHRSCRS